MKLIDFNDHIPEETVATTGNFDGVHTGHRKLLSKMRETALENNWKTAGVTFINHPKSYFLPQQHHQSLTTFEEKRNLLDGVVDYLVQLRFTRAIADLTPEQFLRHLQKSFHMRHYLAGYDHHVGNRQTGSYPQLQLIAERHSFTIDKIGPCIIGGDTVSSTRIKRALADGNVVSATQMLGYHYRLTGTVLHGKMLGRTIGFPTANIDCPAEKVIPARGVYAVTVYIDNQWYYGMLNIGYNPTLSSLEEMSIEVHILDFNRDIYGKTITTELYSRIRDEKAFSSKKELITQLHNDKESVCTYFGI